MKKPPLSHDIGIRRGGRGFSFPNFSRGGGKPGRWFTTDIEYAKWFGEPVETIDVELKKILEKNSGEWQELMRIYPPPEDVSYSRDFLVACKKAGYDAIRQIDYYDGKGAGPTGGSAQAIYLI